LTTERQTGSELESRAETLPDVSVAHRAGSIVHEFVASIVDEAEARAHALLEEAVDEVRARRDEANAGRARIHERARTLKPELDALLDAVRSEASLLSGEPAPEAALPPPMTAAAEHGGAHAEDEGEHVWQRGAHAH
jgi:hypothetical protein